MSKPASEKNCLEGQPAGQGRLTSRPEGQLKKQLPARLAKNDALGQQPGRQLERASPGSWPGCPGLPWGALAGRLLG